MFLFAKFYQLARSSKLLFALALFIICIPFSLVLAFGFYALFYFDYAIEFACLSAGLSLCLFAIFYWLRGQAERSLQVLESDIKADDDIKALAEQTLVKPDKDWNQKDRQVWHALVQQINQDLSHASEWKDLEAHSLKLIETASMHYSKQSFEFSLLEGLAFVEEVSYRYRGMLETYLPGAEYVTVSQIKASYLFAQKHGEKSVNLAKNAVLLYRLLRLTNPVSALVGEIRGKFVDELTQDMLDKIQFNLKKALLQEVASLSIDLYSGRFVVRPTQVQTSNIHQQDKANLAPKLEPIRIAIVGQISAGKSSLVNYLKQEIAAEVDILPATSHAKTYQYHLAEGQDLYLLDMAGLEQANLADKAYLNSIFQADLILWVLKANQSARAQDKALKDALDNYFAQAENKHKQRPQILGILNQIDLLAPEHVDGAVTYNQDLLGIDVIIPMSLTEKDKVDLDKLESLIGEHLDAAKQVQLNRQQYQAYQNQKSLSGQAVRLFKSGKVIFKHALDTRAK